MDLIKKHLIALDLTEEEIIVYMNALETGASTILELAQNTSIPRTTVYLLVDSLVEKGLILLSIDGKKKKYTPASPQELILLAQKKQEQYKETAKALQTDLTQLQAMYNLDHGKPKMQYFQGNSGVKKLFTLSLLADKVYMYFMSSKGRELLEKEGDEYLENISAKMIPSQQIIKETPSNIEFKKNNESSRNEIICLPEHFATNIDYILFGDTVGFISYKDNQPQAIIIEDKEIAYFEKVRFHMIWTMAHSLKNS